MRFGNDKPEFAVIGLGRFGASLALALAQRGHAVLGVDSDPRVVQELADRLTRVVTLDSTDEDALRAVDITAFDTVVVAIGSHFEANLMTTSLLKEIGVRNVICKALNKRQRHILERVGASRVILPEHEAGQRLARDLCTPGLSEQIALGPDHSLAQIRVPRALIGQSLHAADLRRRFNVIVVTVSRASSLTVMPPGEFVFANEDVLSAVGNNDAILRMLEALR